MNPSDSKKLEEIDAKIDECGANRKDQHWLVSKVKEQDREIEELKRYNKVLQKQREDVYNEGVEDGKSQAGARVEELEAFVKEQARWKCRCITPSTSGRICESCQARQLMAEKEKV